MSAEVASKSRISGYRAYKLMRSYVERVREVYSHAIHFKLTSEEIGDNLHQKVMGTPEWKRLPEHARSYVSGYWEAKRDETWRCMAWVLSCDGKLMTNKEVDALTKKEEEEHYAACVEWCGKPSDGSFRHPPSLEEFRQNRNRLWDRFIPKDYKSPWSRIDGDKSRHVWKDENGNPMFYLILR